MSETALFKTTIEIFTSFDPTESEIADLAAEATDGNAYCTKQEVTVVPVRHLAVHTESVDALMDFFALDAPQEPSVSARFHTDDHAFEFTFDVTDALAESSDADLLALRAINWGGDVEADNLFGWYAHTIKAPEAVRAQEYLLARNVGYEVYVDGAQAEAWVRANRPAVALPGGRV